MAYVYILQDAENGRYYVGSTENLDKRYSQHKARKHPSSKRLHTPKLIFKQEFEDIQIARKAERKLKLYKRRDFIEKIVRDGSFKNFAGP